MARHTAFEILYRDYYSRVYGLCRRLLNSTEQAEDAAQETFMRAYRKFDKFDAQLPFWQWIAAIANNHCIDLLRQRNRNQRLFEEDDAEGPSAQELAIAPDRPVLAQLIDSENHTALAEAIGQLPDKFRAPLVLAYFEQHSYNAIAEQLGVSANHVGVLLLRARQRLKTMLANADPAPTTPPAESDKREGQA